jgi:hypothetical protein
MTDNVTPLLDSSFPLLDNSFPLPLHLPFTNRQAADAGVDRHVLSRLAGDGLLRRLVRGVYVASQTPDSIELRTQALALVVPPDAIATDWTACWLWTGVAVPGDHLELSPISVFRPAGRGRLRNDLCHSGERTFAREDVVRAGPLLVTTPLRTAWDLGRFAHRDVAIGGMDALRRLGVFSDDELLGGVERFRRQRGVVQLRGLAPLVDRRAESLAESTLRLRWRDLPTLPQPRPQVPVLSPSGRELARIDLGVEELLFGVEYDGEEYHSSDEDRAHDEQRRDWLLREFGWLIEPVRRENVYGRNRDIEAIIHEGIREARRTLAERLRRRAA